MDDSISKTEKYITRLRKEGRYEEADAEKQYFISLGFEVRDTKEGTKLIWKK